eukprot:TRINITY_DN22947_c0_g1_i1.p1 TRINITY_DN22947_c0_g1~~TRINITY_DN22947_c0_g1_i1.p1  ORF type:complete len:397 (-),score=65.27 TRINITY_DN22947_c0_g1_i1:14-1204(-)
MSDQCPALLLRENVFNVGDAQSPSHRLGDFLGLTVADLGAGATEPCSSRHSSSAGSSDALDDSFMTAIFMRDGIGTSHGASRLSSPGRPIRRAHGHASDDEVRQAMSEVELPIYEYSESQAPAACPPRTGAGVPLLSLEWLLQLSYRSGAEESILGSLGGAQSRRISAPGAETGDDFGRLSRATSATSRTTATSTAAVVRNVDTSEVGTAFERLTNSGDDVEEEEVISVFDISDAPGSARFGVDARSVFADVARGELSSGLFSPRHSSPRRGGRSDVSVPESTFGSVLRRLASEAQLLDESVSRSVRRAVAMHSAVAAAPTQRLSDDEIRALPQVCFDDEEQQHCAICLESYQEGELLTKLRCDHFFHVECVARWLQRNTECPLCRMSSVHSPEAG